MARGFSRGALSATPRVPGTRRLRRPPGLDRSPSGATLYHGFRRVRLTPATAHNVGTPPRPHHGQWGHGGSPPESQSPPRLPPFRVVTVLSPVCPPLAQRVLSTVARTRAGRGSGDASERPPGALGTPRARRSTSGTQGIREESGPGQGGHPCARGTERPGRARARKSAGGFEDRSPASVLFPICLYSAFLPSPSQGEGMGEGARWLEPSCLSPLTLALSPRGERELLGKAVC